MSREYSRLSLADDSSEEGADPRNIKCDHDEFQELQEELKNYHDELKRKQELRDMWHAKVVAIEAEIDHIKHDEADVLHRIRHSGGHSVHFNKNGEFEIDTDPWDSDSEAEEAPGPSCLRWVDGPWFSLISMLVVLTNVIIMVGEQIYDPLIQAKDELVKLDFTFLGFYVVEISLKAILWQGKLLKGPWSRIWANWLDLIIIVLSLFEMIILPIFNVARTGQMQALRAFRLLRFARIVRIFSALNKSTQGLAENDTFALLIMGVIGVNCFLMGVQIDHPEWRGWRYIENVFLAIFVFEMYVRLHHYGCRFFYEDEWAMNWLDFGIVVGGVLDCWLIPIVSFISTQLGGPLVDKNGLGRAVNLLRMLRLLRLLRLIRLVRSIPPLFQLLKGIVDAMHGMLWLLVLTIAVIYIIALAVIMLWGKGGLLINGKEPDDVFTVFPSMPIAMWTLFMAMNGDPSGMQPLFDNHPESLLFATLYMVFSSFAILSVLTGVVADKMASASEELSEQNQTQMSNTKEVRARELLKGAFSGKGRTTLITKEEFTSALSDPDLMLELTDSTGLETDQLESAFDSLSKDIGLDARGNKVDVISEDDLIDGMIEAKQTPDMLSIRRIEKQLAKLQRSMDKKL